jgi:hypothetical protein
MQKLQEHCSWVVASEHDYARADDAADGACDARMQFASWTPAGELTASTFAAFASPPNCVN